ncbi:hypothetical protein [Aeoliella sp. SH292]|uniref:hypothetical protein n=1 Tax=Aeoliella sp. SH292 TaxID=3454464 RepID=UPI003F9B1D4F
MKEASHSILAEPITVGLTRKCLACNKRFALEHLRTAEHPTLGHLKTYQCKHCGVTFNFATRLPDGAL